MGMKVMCYHHNDMDGITSAAIVKKYFKDDKVSFTPCDYQQDMKLVVKDGGYDKVVVVDFSFPREDSEKLLKEFGDDFIWIDHHISAVEKLDGLEIKGLRDRSNNSSGCGLAWKYFFPGEPIPRSVSRAEDFDLWKFLFKSTRAYAEGFKAHIKAPTDKVWSDLLNEHENDTFLNIVEMGETLLLAQKARIDKTFREGIDGEFEGYKCRFCNTNHDISTLGEYIYKDKQYPLAVMFSYRDGKMVINLRSNTIDVSKIAVKYGGGGHTFASGFTATYNDMEKILNLK